jgi:hypothetical protein
LILLVIRPSEMATHRATRRRTISPGCCAKDQIARYGAAEFCASEIELQMIRNFERLNDVLDVNTPAIQRILSLSQKFMPLVDGSNAGNRARLMVEDFVGDVRRNA